MIESIPPPNRARKGARPSVRHSVGDRRAPPGGSPWARPLPGSVGAGERAVYFHFRGYVMLLTLPARPYDAVGRGRLLYSSSRTRCQPAPGTEGA